MSALRPPYSPFRKYQGCLLWEIRHSGSFVHARRLRVYATVFCGYTKASCGYTKAYLWVYVGVLWVHEGAFWVHEVASWVHEGVSWVQEGVSWVSWVSWGPVFTHEASSASSPILEHLGWGSHPGPPSRGPRKDPPPKQVMSMSLSTSY